MIDKFKETFREEAVELLNNLENSLLELETDPSNKEEVAYVFRTMHTIKGSSAMFGFQHISGFTHRIENLMEYLREGKIIATKDFINLTLESRDHIRTLLETSEPVDESIAALSEDILKRFESLVKGMLGRPESSEGRTDTTKEEPPKPKAGESAAEASKHGEAVPEGRKKAVYRIHFKPVPEVTRNGTNLLLLLDELASMGDYSCMAGFEELPALEELEPENVYMNWEILLTTSLEENAIRDVFIFIESLAKIEIALVDDLSDIEDETKIRLGQILVERGVVNKTVVESAVKSQKRIGEVLVNEGIDEGEVASALQEQEHIRKSRQKLQNEMATGSVRVNSEKLDNLVDLVGELVTLQARLSQTAAFLHDAQLLSIAEICERLTSELRDSTMSMRMLPIGTTFSKFRRLVRDLCNDLGKDADLVTEGGETELDKTVIEKLNDPLVHLIRNCLDHGIESPAARVRAGKPQKGLVKLSAIHSGASVHISVQDDGGGLNKERILKKAIDRGLVQRGTELSEQEIFQLIFAAGLSTSENVTTVSGRGVGMDVVKKEIDGLGGSVTVASKEGAFTKITLRIPLTLAIIEGLLVEIGKENFVFPLSSVEECIELTADMRKEKGNKKIINNRGELLPYIRLRELFGVDGELPAIEQIVVVNALDSKIGFVVDNVIGDYQTVIKNMGRMYRGLEGISGATILGDGSVALILDVQKLSAISARREESAAKMG